MATEYTKLAEKLPPGWDCKYDQSTGKCYYINYLTKAMQLEDPRMRYKQLQNERCSTESIPMQQMHGSPYHVYPASNFPAAIRAFQGPNPSLYNVSSSPLLPAKTQQQMEMSPVLRHGSPQTPRLGNGSNNSSLRLQAMQETSFTNQLQFEADAIVAKINNMFPTASENHIRLLLKKYYNREAVVISALQVEKHPVTMPGPSNSGYQMTPPSKRLEMISRTGSPIPGRPNSVTSGLYGSPRIGEQIRNSPKPHSSPKMKLRYLKSVFPKADETLLFDVLANSDNNVQSASEKLLAMGYVKREVSAPRLSNRVKELQQEGAGPSGANDTGRHIPLQPKVLTTEERNAVKVRIQNRYNSIAERIVLMALESVDYSEDRASQILDIVMKEDESKATATGGPREKTTKSDDAKKDESQSVPDSKNDPQKVLSLPTASPSKSATPCKSTKFTKHSSVPKSSSKSSLTSSKVKLSDAVETSAVLKIAGMGDGELSQSQNCPQQPKTTTANDNSNHNNNNNIQENGNNNNAEATTKSNSRKCDGTTTSVLHLQSSSSFSSSSTSEPSSADSSSSPNDGNQKFKKSRSKIKLKSTPRGSTDTVLNSEHKKDFESIVGRVGNKGPNPDLCKGPNDEILLADYVTWNGANPDISQGRKGLSSGTDKNLLSDRNYSTHGHNGELCKGPKVGLAKGSLYSQVNRNVKCN